MGSQTSIAPPPGEQLPDALATYLKAARSGQAVDPRQLFAAYPSLVTELTALLLERAVPPTQSTGRQPVPLAEADTRPALPEPLPVPAQLTRVGDYELLEELSRGGMGRVYKARHERLDRIVALKIIRPERLDNPEAVRRFQREARAAARLAHPNIVAIYDADACAGQHYLAMEFLEGIDLARLVATRGPLPIAQACDFIRQAAVGMQHAFERGMVHRDLKPSNLLVTFPMPHPGRAVESATLVKPVVKILDLGLARFDGLLAGTAATATLTRDGDLLGTPDYMAPEQVENPHATDIRADLYSLGCTLYFLLTGQPPFPEGSLVQKFDKHRWEAPVPAGKLRPDVPPAVDGVLGRLLAKQPDQRYTTPAALAIALEPLSVVGVRGESGPRPAAGQDVPVTRQCHRLLGHKDWVRALAVLPAGVGVVSGGRDRTVRLWDLATGRETMCGASHADGVRCLAVLPDSRHAISGSKDHSLRRWDLATGQVVGTFKGHTGEVWGVAVSPDGRHVLSGGTDQSLRWWDAVSGRELRQLGGLFFRRHGDAVLSVAIAPDGRRALSGSMDRTARLWDLETGQELHCLTGHTDGIPGVAIAPDGRSALTASVDRTLRLWDLDSGKEQMRLEGHERTIFAVTYSPDGRHAASCSKDGTVRLWDLVTGVEVHRFLGHAEWVIAVAFTPDGRRLLSGGADRMICVWDVPGSQPLAA